MLIILYLSIIRIWINLLSKSYIKHNFAQIYVLTCYQAFSSAIASITGCLALVATSAFGPTDYPTLDYAYETPTDDSSSIDMSFSSSSSSSL